MLPTTINNHTSTSMASSMSSSSSIQQQQHQRRSILVRGSIAIFVIVQCLLFVSHYSNNGDNRSKRLNAGNNSNNNKVLDHLIVRDHEELIRNLSRNLRHENLSDSEMKRCTRVLEETSDQDGKLDHEGYVNFLEEYSSNTLSYENFADIPMSLVMIFYSAACSDSQDCEQDHAAIRLQHFPSGLRNLLCQSIDEVVGSQVEFRFQFQVNNGKGLTANDIMTEVDGNTAKESLRLSTEAAVLNSFGCESFFGQQRKMRKLKYESKTLLKGSTELNGGRRSGGGDKRSLADTAECPYKVVSKITGALDMMCAKAPANASRCSIIKSTVLVTALPGTDGMNEIELRKHVADTLADEFAEEN